MFLPAIREEILVVEFIADLAGDLAEAEFEGGAGREQLLVDPITPFAAETAFGAESQVGVQAGFEAADQMIGRHPAVLFRPTGPGLAEVEAEG